MNYKIIALMSTLSTYAQGVSVYSLVGRKAPDFTAEAVIVRKITQLALKDYQGSYVVLFFYPEDFTFVCPTELLALQEAQSAFAERNTRVIGCSTDTAESHLKWLKKKPRKGGIKGVTFPLIADTQAQLAKAFQALGAGNRALRTTVIIDAKGIVQSISIDNAPFGRCIDEILRKIDAIQSVEKNGQVCPANWKTGQPTMTPSTQGLIDYMRKK